MTNNIKPEHYRKGEIDLFESWYLTYPFEQYRAIMQSHAEKYLRRNKVDRVEDLGKAIYCLKILREKEIEQDRYSHVKTNYGELLEKDNIATEWTPAPEDVLGQVGFRTSREKIDSSKSFIRDIDASELLHNQKDNRNIRLLNSFLDSGYNYLARDENGDLWKYQSVAKRDISFWNDSSFEDTASKIDSSNFPEVKWTDGEPTRIIDLLETYSKSDVADQESIDASKELQKEYESITEQQLKEIERYSNMGYSISQLSTLCNLSERVISLKVDELNWGSP